MNFLLVEERRIMAERRMLSKKIFQSRPFLMMPFEAQALYTHLVLSSDDYQFD